MSPVEHFFTELRDIHATGAGVAETSLYAPLSELFNAIGKHLDPKVRCVMQMKNRGAGMPDGGFFTAEQCKKIQAAEKAGRNESLFQVQTPSRGVLEVKAPSADLKSTLGSEQVSQYWQKYGLVLVTNFREFALVGRDAGGQRTILERHTLAESEAAFWTLMAHPRAAAQHHGERLLEYLRRILLHNAPLASPQDLAEILASYARDARARVEHADLPALTGLRQALEESLGLTFEGEKGEHFFRSTLVQTLFYGIFAAWVLWAKQQPAPQGVHDIDLAGLGRYPRFDWKLAEWSLRVPMIGALYEQLANKTQLEPLGLIEVLDWASTALNRVDRAAFFNAFEEGHAVQYFYEPFLQAFDPALRKELGVWYTPSEIVQYMVARVDTVLREELGLPDGLADPRVVVLDPCCGTGAYLVEVLRRIAETLRAKGGDGLMAQRLKRAALERVFGFEILPAPFVIAHLQIGLFLQSLGAPLAEQPPERCGVYLTNALTGWDPAEEPKTKLLLPEMAEERDAAAKVKRDARILVVIGNPPYNAFAGVSPKEEKGLVEPYKQGLISEWGIKKFNLDDLYVRFFRLAERRIAEMTGEGVVCFISNHSWIQDPSFVVLREHLMKSFDRFWIDNLHGNRKISEYAPDGRTSETIFATSGFSVGIQQGVAISTWVRRSERSGECKVLFRDDLNAARAVDRRAQLLDSLKSDTLNDCYERTDPSKTNRYGFRPSMVGEEYLLWPQITDLCLMPPSYGLMEKRGGALIDIDSERLKERMLRYYNKAVSWDGLKAEKHPLVRDAARFHAQKAREKVIFKEQYDENRLLRYLVRPFDLRWCYYSPVRPLWNEPRPSLWRHHWRENGFLISRFKCSSDPEGIPFYWTSRLIDDHCLAPDAAAIPIWVQANVSKSNGLEKKLRVLRGLPSDIETANVSATTKDYLKMMGFLDPSNDADQAGSIWRHVLAIGFSPEFLNENADGIREDWPRIPLPATRERLFQSAELGRKVAELLDTESQVAGVTVGEIRSELRPVAVIERMDGQPVDPAAGDLDVTAGWGHAGQGGVTMPGRGKLVATEFDAAGNPSGYDVYLNNQVRWRHVSRAVWEFTIGGYQVMKKWLSYRERTLLGRGLTLDEAEEVTHMARRLAALVALQPALDANYQAVKEHVYAWPSEP